MAIAGLHNVSVLDSPFLRESQSPVSSRRSDQARLSTQTSSPRQMWRDLEDEQVGQGPGRGQGRFQQQRSDELNTDLSSVTVSESQRSVDGGGLDRLSEVEYGPWSQSQAGSQNENDDSNGLGCEPSPDFGDVERERVRQIFRDWMNSGMMGHTSNVSQVNNTTRAQWLGETEQERVRIVREWVQMTSQPRDTLSARREEQVAEIGAQIERVRDGLVVNCHEGQTEPVRRVGILRLCGRQALLDMLVRTGRERQRELQQLSEHRVVSDFAHRNRIQSLLRGRFLRNNRLAEDERPASVAASELGLLRQRRTVSGLREGFLSRLDNSVCGSSNCSDTLSDSDIDGYGHDQNQANGSLEVLDEIHDQSEQSQIISDIHDTTNVLEGNSFEDINQQESTAQVQEWQEQVLENEDRGWQQSDGVGFIEVRSGNAEDSEGNWQENSQEILRNEGGQDHLQEAHEVFQEQLEPSSRENDAHGLSVNTNDLEGDTIENVNWQNSIAQVEEWQEQVRENEEASGSEGGEHGFQEEAHDSWHEVSSQEVAENWLEGPSDQEAVMVGRVDRFYFPDDDNVYNMELRELLSRRSVSNLLRSGFRENLDRLIQSYVERQVHDPVEWEPHGTSSLPASAEQDQEQQTGDQNEGRTDDVESPPSVLPSSQVPRFLPLWDQELHHDNWSQQNMHPRFGMEWEVINDLRIDLARLQQRMNNMQRMLEACMDMQLELQRSIKQEVSAALNRSVGSPEVNEECLPKDGSKWDHVRKGICCICCDSHIDSLLYRCGHMCTCSKCASELVQGRGKCPMCWAPVVEVIRAYSIL